MTGKPDIFPAIVPALTHWDNVFHRWIIRPYYKGPVYDLVILKVTGTAAKIAAPFFLLEHLFKLDRPPLSALSRIPPPVACFPPAIVRAIMLSAVFRMKLSAAGQANIDAGGFLLLCRRFLGFSCSPGGFLGLCLLPFLFFNRKLALFAVADGARLDFPGFPQHLTAYFPDMSALRIFDSHKAICSGIASQVFISGGFYLFPAF